MTRPRQFEPAAALEAAMMLFWQHGYDAVSLDDIVRSTGASRKGLYGLWPGKQALLVAALTHYRQQVGDYFFTDLERDGAGLGEIAGFWDRFEQATSQPSWHGCLIMRTSTTEVGQEADVSGEIIAYFDRMQDAVRHALDGAAEQDDLPKGIDPVQASSQVLAVAIACSTIGVLEGYSDRVAALIAGGRAACGLASAAASRRRISAKHPD